MTDRETNERIRGAFSASLDLADGGAHCPPSERLWDAAHGELQRHHVAEVLLHCGECGVCAEAWRLAWDVEPLEETRPGRAWGGLRYAVAAVVVAGLAGLALFLLPRQSPTSPPVFRETGSATIESITAAVQPRNACVLSWTAAFDGGRFDLRVMTEDLDLLHAEWGLSETTFAVPPTALEPVAAGERILWQLTLRTPKGETFVSETFATEID